MSNPVNKITPNDYIRITPQSYFVGNKETLKYRGELVLCRDYTHRDIIAEKCKKYPNMTAIRCMISESNIPYYGDEKFWPNWFDYALKYRLENPSVTPGKHKYMCVEFCNRYIIPWYWIGTQYVEKKWSHFTVCYTVNSLVDSAVSSLLYDNDIEEMLDFFDGDPLSVKSKTKQWEKRIEQRQNLLIKKALIKQI